MKSPWIKLTPIAIALMLVAVGCGSNTVPPIPTLGAPVTVFPTGTFYGTGVNASWSWVFNTDNSYASSGTRAAERGTYTVTGNQIVVKGDYCGDVTGTYTWISDGQALSFTAVDDACADRLGIIVGVWVKKP